MKLEKRYSFLLLLLPLMWACHRNPLDVNVSGIRVDLQVGRLDQDLFTVTPANIQKVVPTLQKKYDPFFSVYNKEILAIGDSRESLYAGYLLTFVKDSTIHKARLRSDSLFNDFKPFHSQLEQAFNREMRVQFHRINCGFGKAPRAPRRWLVTNRPKRREQF